MRVRISITLSKELLRTVDECARQQKSTRSNIIESALRVFLKWQTEHDERNARDLQIINEHADSLNREAVDVLGYSLP
jgi:metal-responsive CopG/Arc/MetJ family transcriptional regulator